MNNDDHRIEVNLKNIDNPRIEDNFKNEDNPKNKMILEIRTE